MSERKTAASLAGRRRPDVADPGRSSPQDRPGSRLRQSGAPGRVLPNLLPRRDLADVVILAATGFLCVAVAVMLAVAIGLVL